MKKFWPGNVEVSARDGTVGTPQQHYSNQGGRLNLAYENEHGLRRPSDLEDIEEEDDEELSLNSQPETGLAGFKLSPQASRQSETDAESQEGVLDFREEDDEELGAEEEGREAAEDEEYNIHDPPRPSLSRAQLLPYLLDSLDHIDEVCTDPHCPYNQWLYLDHAFPTEASLQRWNLEGRRQEEGQGRDWNQEYPALGGRDCVHQVREKTKWPGVQMNRSGFAGEFSNMESTKIAPGYAPPGSRKPDIDLTAVPPPYQPYLGMYPPSSPSYPIVTLPRSARKGLKKVKGSRLADRMEARPTSACSCTSTLSASSCSTCIHEPVDPTAPHAFTVQDRKLGGRQRRRCLPACNISCCASLSFMAFSLLGLVCVLLYLYFNTNTMHNEMTLH